MNESAAVFKPNPITLRLGDEEYELVYDLNAFCEMEKLYDSVDSVLQMLLGASPAPDLEKVTYKDIDVAAKDVKVDGISLSAYIGNLTKAKDVKHSDTLKMLWLGCLHNHCIYDDQDEITGYTISKAKLGAYVTFRNLREVNGKILTSILRDLMLADAVKNAEAPEEVTEEAAQLSPSK